MKKDRSSYLQKSGLYERIYRIVCQIPNGKVATYGQIAGIVGNCGARQVGYALSSLSSEQDVPWHRVINSQGRISKRSDPGGDLVQRKMLEMEGVMLDEKEVVDLEVFGWNCFRMD